MNRLEIAKHNWNVAERQFAQAQAELRDAEIEAHEKLQEHFRQFANKHPENNGEKS